MQKFSRMTTIYIHVNTHLFALKYHRVPTQIAVKILTSKFSFLPLLYRIGSSNICQFIVPNMHNFFVPMCKGQLSYVNEEK